MSKKLPSNCVVRMTDELITLDLVCRGSKDGCSNCEHDNLRIPHIWAHVQIPFSQEIKEFVEFVERHKSSEIHKDDSNN